MRLSRGGWSLGALLLIVIAALVAFSKKQAIADWWELRNYSPQASIITLANQDSMTPKARHIFYVNHPQLISDVAQFRRQCNFSEQTIVLGCYHPDQQGVDVYRVTDSRLNGVEQVTAAHEMLHAAYDRLSGKEKQTINAELMDFYTHDLQDIRVHQTIDLYKQTEPNAGVRRLQAEIRDYNDLVEKRNALATELKGLQSSIDTRLTTQAAQ
jgi:hypothetical protein